MIYKYWQLQCKNKGWLCLQCLLDKSNEETDSTKEEAAKMEKEYETLKDSTKIEEQNTAGNTNQPKGT